MRAGGGPIDICIRDISSRGIMAQADEVPERGTYVEILRPSLALTGRVMWSRDGRFGIQTRERVCIESLLERRQVQRGDGGSPPLIQGTAPEAVRRAARRAEAARRFAGKFQQGVLMAGAAAGAISAASLLYSNLAPVFANVTTALR